MKRNQIVITVTVCALAFMCWSSYLAYRRYAQLRRAQNVGVVLNQVSEATQEQTDFMPEIPDLRGKRAAGFTLDNLAGKRVSLRDYQGKAVLINFWATWCTPCAVELPWLIELQKKYASQGFEVLGIDDDYPEDRDKVKPFAQKEGINYPVLFGNDRIAKTYNCCDFLPMSYYIGRDGKIVAQIVGLRSRDEIESDIRKALTTNGSS